MILIFGGNGFVGQHVARRLIDMGERVAVTARSHGSNPTLLANDLASGAAQLLHLDVTDSFAVMEAVSRLRPRVVIDLTGYHPKALSPGRDVAFRTSALLNVLESARIHKVARVVLMSSMDVYWGLPTCQAPFSEEDTVPLLEPDDHFIVQSWAKKSLEVIGNLYRRQHAMDIAFIRASGIYGPLYRTYLNVPSQLVRAAFAGGGEIGGPGGPFADGGYDQLYVKDMARGVALVALTPSLRFPVYNIGSGRAPTYGEFVDAVSAAMPNVTIALPSRPPAAAPDPMDGRWMSIERARTELGFVPEFEPESAIADYLAWINAHGL